MDWLNQAKRFLGNIFGGAQRAIGQISGNVARTVGQAEQQAARTAQQAVRNIPQIQAPRFQLPQVRIQAPRIQVPQAPRVDLGAIGRALQQTQQQVGQFGKGLGEGANIGFKQITGQPLTQREQQVIDFAKKTIPTAQPFIQTTENISKFIKETQTRQQAVNQARMQQLKERPGQVLAEGLSPFGAISRTREMSQVYLGKDFVPKIKTTQAIDDISKELAKLPTAKIPGIGVVSDVVKPIITEISKFIISAPTGSEEYSKGVKGVGEYINGLVTIASLAYTGGLSKQLATKGTAFLPTAAKLAPRLAASGAGQNVIQQLAEGKKLNEIDPKQIAAAAAAYAGLGIGIPGVTRGVSAGIGKAFAKGQAGLTTKAVQQLPTDKNALVIARSLPEKGALRAQGYTNVQVQFRPRPGQVTPTIPGRAIAETTPVPKGQEAIFNEARNYKTAKDFVNSQPVGYHFTSPETNIKKWSTKNSFGRIWFTDNPNVGENVGASARGKMYTVRFDKNAKWATPEQADKSFTDQLIAEGYDGVLYPDSTGKYGNYYEIFNPKVIKSETQLNKIWNQANKQGPQAIYETVPSSAMRPKPQVGKGIEEQLRSKYPNSQFDVFDSGKNISVSRIVVDKSARNTGTGTKAMQDIIDYADKTGKRVTLTPTSDFGGSKSRLINFYKRFGFVENKGRTKDLSISDTMYRAPKNQLGVRDSLADGLPNQTGKPIVSQAPQVGKTAQAKVARPIYETVPESAMRPKAPKGEVVPPVREMQPIPTGQERARFAVQLGNDAEIPNEVLKDLFPGYTRLPNETVFKNANKILETNQPKFIEDIISGKLPPSAENNAASMIALRRLIDEGGKDNLKKATRLAQATIAQGTDAGRAVQIFSRWRSTTPEGATIQAQKIINEYNEKIAGKLIGKKQFLELTPDKQTKIVELANNVQKYADGTRERQVSEALLGKYIAELVPLTKGQKLASVQYIAQLLNVKTAIRNVLGNTTAAGANDTANVLASGIDAALYRLGWVKQRSVTLPNIMKGLKGAKKGAQYAIEDVQLGIKTSGAMGSYEIKPQVFKNGILRRLENALGYELSVPDKAFYQRAFDISLDNQMRAAAKSGKGVTKPTAQMIAQANEEGLYQTFQNNSIAARALTVVKKGLNYLGTPNRDFGAGNFIINYPKTPGNIIAQGVDFTPVGIFRGAYNLAKVIRNELPATAQRNAVLNIGRGLTGTGLLSLGWVLANVGIMSATRDPNKKVSSFERVTGAGPFTINLTALQRFVQGGDPAQKQGDLVVNYDWLQPNAIQLSMGANLRLAPTQKNKAGEFMDNLVSSINASVNTVVEQPVLSGVSRVLSKVAGGGFAQSDIVGAIADTFSSVPSSFIPSTINQIGQSLDKFSRETRSANPAAEAYNKTIARIPFLRERLPMKYDVLGKPINTFDPEAGGNNFFNVFLNPSFPRKIKDDAAIRLIDDLYQKTGSTEQFPKVTGDAVEISRDGKAERIKLSTDQISQYQQYVGTRTEAAYQQLSQDPRFASLSPEDQVKKIANIITDINTAARMELFGHSPSQPDKAALNIIQGGNPVDYALTPKVKAKKPKSPKIPKVRKGRAGRAGGKRVSLKAPRLRRIKVSAPKGTRRVSFKQPTPTRARKTIKIKTG